MLRRGHWSAPVSALLAGTLVSNLLTSRRIDLMHFPGWILCKATKPGVSFSVYFFGVPVSFSLLIHICFVCSTASLMCKVTGWGDVCQKTKRVFFCIIKPWAFLCCIEEILATIFSATGGPYSCPDISFFTFIYYMMHSYIMVEYCSINEIQSLCSGFWKLHTLRSYQATTTWISLLVPEQTVTSSLA